MGFCLSVGRKYCEKIKIKKCWFPELSPFLTMFSKGDLLELKKNGILN